MMYDREVLFAVALLSSILTAIPIVLLALLAGPRRAHQWQPEPEPESEPEPWRPQSYESGYHWEKTADDGNPYSWRFVRDDEVQP